MNPTANAALARALSSRVPVNPPPPKAPRPAPVEKKTLAVPGKPEQPKRLDQWGFREGHKDATDFVLSMTATLKMPGGKQQVIDQLKQAAGRRPDSQALGMWRVIELLEEAA